MQFTVDPAVVGAAAILGGLLSVAAPTLVRWCLLLLPTLRRLGTERAQVGASQAQTRYFDAGTINTLIERIEHGEQQRDAMDERVRAGEGEREALEVRVRVCERNWEIAREALPELATFSALIPVRDRPRFRRILGRLSALESTAVL